ncbi:MAG TPA: hypothetical protein VGC77_12245 [Rhodopseudomonas sp.]|uniref:hypothetical protein n=1 Tax=Rhodopseudomonas sp. TaxID=1078 RepID=UPI002EDB0095
MVSQPIDDQAAAVTQAKSLKEQASVGGLRFELYLPPDLAEWLLGLVESGTFDSPAEAAFSLLSEAKDLAPHKDLRQEILRRSIERTLNDSRPSIPFEEVMNGLRKMMRAPPPEPAVWKTSRK